MDVNAREEMNASLNTVVSEISAKLKQQEEDRIAQDTENANLHKELQVRASLLLITSLRTGRARNKHRSLVVALQIIGSA